MDKAAFPAPHRRRSELSQQQIKQERENAVADFVLRPVDAVMLCPALGGEAVFTPLLFDMNQRALSRAVDEVLQSGSRSESENVI